MVIINALKKGKYLFSKILVFLIVCILVEIFLAGYKPYGIYDAAVDTTSGNIAILITQPKLQALVITEDGEIQYIKDLEELTDGRGLLCYDEYGNLFFYAYRKDATYCIQCIDNDYTEHESAFSFKKEERFEGWDKHLTYKEWKTKDGFYRYQNGSYFGRRFGGEKSILSFSSENTDNKPIWEES